MVEYLWSSDDAQLATGGKSSGKWIARSISIDSRSIKKGDLFVALSGDNFDGHDFVSNALKKGAAAAIVERVPDGVDADSALLVVDDSLAALVEMAKFARKRSKAKIIAVTGSVGKTTTKEMIKVALEDQGKVFASSGNFNNHIGLPLSLANMPGDAEFAIFEMGMNHAGEISHLSNIANPDIAVITAIAPVHLEFFNSVEEIAKAKSEIFDGLVTGGSVVLNCDDEYYNLLRDRAGQNNIVTFGTSSKADAVLRDSSFKTNMQIAEVDIFDKNYELSLRMYGRHNMYNALASLVVAEILGVKIDIAIDNLSQLEAGTGRGKTYLVNDILIIDQSYNASPSSMVAAFEVMAQIKENAGGRAIAVVGDMFELGDDAVQMHKDLKQNIADLKIDKVFCAGSLMKNLYDALPSDIKGYWGDKALDILPGILNEVRANDIVMIKGSRGMHMEEVMNGLLAVGNEKDVV